MLRPLEHDADLVRDIAFILPRVPGALPKCGRDLYGDWAQMMARAIVDHLRLANWRFERGEPLRGHSTPPMR